ncbi:hypothetical protein GCM10009810_29750 [Nostocoides vanveenii]|uniref:Amidophosphoribosyltransferase n=1 Tax=Nostocoides vanveenii TaxID=330835 RepID=A0ABP4X6S0_9MICO
MNDWMDWMLDQADFLMPVGPHHQLGCELCHGAVGFIGDGPNVWPRCPQCRGYGDVIDRLVPITYSIDAGLESALHRYKDFGAAWRWLRLPLACLVHTFLTEHGSCIDQAAGTIDVATCVPSNNQDRAFDHIDGFLRGAVRGDPSLDRFAWEPGLVSRDPATSRPERGELKPSAYRVSRQLEPGSAVLLFDDTWTSGSSAASTAAALKASGAGDVTVLTLGRQLRSDGEWGTTPTLCKDRRQRSWRRDQCVLCC